MSNWIQRSRSVGIILLFAFAFIHCGGGGSIDLGGYGGGTGVGSTQGETDVYGLDSQSTGASIVESTSDQGSYNIAAQVGNAIQQGDLTSDGGSYELTTQVNF